jgi:hypothetical protein
MIEAIGLMKEYAEFYLKRIQALEDLLNTLLEVLKSLKDLDVYLYSFFGKGGNSLLISELQEALFNPDTAHRPPFDNAGDMVLGVVGVAGGREPLPFEPLLTLYNLLFGQDPDARSVSDLPDPNTAVTSDLPDQQTEVPGMDDLIDFFNAASDEMDRAASELVAGTIPTAPDDEDLNLSVPELHDDTDC